MTWWWWRCRQQGGSGDTQGGVEVLASVVVVDIGLYAPGPPLISHQAWPAGVPARLVVQAD